MPRVVPKTPEYAAYLDERARMREAAHEFRQESQQALERVVAKHGLPPFTGRKGDGPYSPDPECRHSWFRDLLRVAEHEAGVSHAIQAGAPLLMSGGSGRSTPGPPGVDDSLSAVRARLAAVEQRDVTTADPGGAAFLPAGSPPGFVAEAFASSLRAKSVLPGILNVQPLPPAGTKVETARLATGSTVGVQAAEMDAVSETDFESDTVTSLVCTLSGQVDMSGQLFDRSVAAVDVVLARELGEALGATLDAQILFGTGSAGQLRGLANTVGITSLVKTNASPTAATNWTAIGDLVSQTATAFGANPDTIVLHPRRLAFLRAKLGYKPEWPVPNIVACNGVRTTLGVSTSEDDLYALVTNEIFLYLGRPVFRVFPQVQSANLKTRFQVVQYCALHAGRKPVAIGRLSGSEFVAPVFT